MEEFRWFKSSRSAGNGHCVEVAVFARGVVVRDSKDSQGPVLTFDAAVWQDFIASVQTGVFQLG